MLKKPNQQLAPSYVLSCQGQSNYINGVETLSAFIIKQRLCFRPLYERRFPHLKVMRLKSHTGCCCICSIIKVNIFLSLQCLLIPTRTCSELLSCSSTAYPTSWAAPVVQLAAQQASIHPSTHLSTWSAPGWQEKGRKKKKKNKPSHIHHADLLPRS